MSEYVSPALDRQALQPSETLSRQALIALYKPMQLARSFETRLGRLYRQGKIAGAVYLGTGQEAIATGVTSLLQPDDYISTVARNLAGWFVRGVDPRHVMARWFGKDQAPSHGKDLGLFLADLKHYGIAPYHNGSMASWIPSGAGFALAFRQRGESRINVAFTGDGATSPGDFYEGLSIAAIHKLPLLVIIENNGYAYSTSPEHEMPVKHVAERSAAFGIPSAIGFGNDVFEVRRMAREAIDYVRAGNGPYLLEFKCFRMRGHGEHDDMGYVPEAQRAWWDARDPVTLLRTYLTGPGGFSEEEVAAIDEDCKQQVDEAVEYAQNLPMPAAATALQGVFKA
ncbi:thiamine pyrophosphate-dependent dehydrogenase E1 component subunit alpha [Castellaniella caeni]|uniref:thiamine pyrophosphate-dependent dehydrogenase E1 component subunit alpha n=1 Tax=Castellaniella caeni TaxID=266123 RepID=UPI000829795A|nr:thiamine pyrophosphate-dependent dehydrogenase E1 component subunit alpha [Castellaniella caeni]